MPELFNASSYLVDRHVDEGRGDRGAVTGPAGTLSYAELAAQVRSLAAGLRELGIRPEERVVMVASDSPGLLAVILAVMRIGAVAVPVNTMLTGTELAELLQDTRARVAFVSGEFAAAAAAAAAAAPSCATWWSPRRPRVSQRSPTALTWPRFRHGSASPRSPG